jgi:RND family efflux transporter MFP subunit
MDLSPLKIEREPSPRRRARPSRWIGRGVLLAVLIALGLLFRRPLLGLVDRLRLSEVRVLQVSATSPLSAGAVQGTAANGYVVARTRAALSADTPGRIVEMNVTEGQVVPRGFVVARLYAEEYQALFERAAADLALAERAVESAHAAAEVARGAQEQALAQARAAGAEVRDGEAALEWAELERTRAEALLAKGVASQERLDETRVLATRARARLEALGASLGAAEAAARSAELEFALSESRLGEAEALVLVKRAEHEQARATLDKTEVRAPFDGVVVLKDAEVGEVVSPNAASSQSRGSVATMVDFASLEVQVEVPETSLASVALGRPAKIFLDAYPEHAYDGEVLRIWPTANRQKATVEVRVGFAAIDDKLRPEMGARVVFPAADAPAAPAGGAPSKPVILLPRSAIVTIEGRPHAFVLERDVARQRALTLGEERAGRVVVEQGLTSGEKVIDAPPDALRDGERVRVTS